jgi:hypothetical protein
MSENSLIPVSDEQAKAIQEALKTLQGFGGFLEKTFGTMPEDIVALLGGDYLKVRRAENLHRMIGKAKQRLEDRHVEHPDAPPSLAIPIMIAAADESRDELQDIWASLLAAAADPGRSRSFRLKFIEVVKNMDPLDARVLAQGSTQPGVSFDRNKPDIIASPLKCRTDEVLISVENLEHLGLARRLGADNGLNGNYANITPLARELLRAIAADET